MKYLLFTLLFLLAMDYSASARKLECITPSVTVYNRHVTVSNENSRSNSNKSSRIYYSISNDSLIRVNYSRKSVLRNLENQKIYHFDYDSLYNIRDTTISRWTDGNNRNYTARNGDYTIGCLPFFILYNGCRRYKTPDTCYSSQMSIDTALPRTSTGKPKITGRMSLDTTFTIALTIPKCDTTYHITFQLNLRDFCIARDTTIYFQTKDNSTDSIFVYIGSDLGFYKDTVITKYDKINRSSFTFYYDASSVPVSDSIMYFLYVTDYNIEVSPDTNVISLDDLTSGVIKINLNIEGTQIPQILIPDGIDDHAVSEPDELIGYYNLLGQKLNVPLPNSPYFELRRINGKHVAIKKLSN